MSDVHADSDAHPNGICCFLDLLDKRGKLRDDDLTAEQRHAWEYCASTGLIQVGAEHTLDTETREECSTGRACALLADTGRAALNAWRLDGQPSAGGRASSELTDLVRLSQAAPLTGLSTRTLRRYVQNGRLPRPDIEGGDGKANLWEWSRLRPKLQAVARRTLPHTFPASRIRP